MASSEIGSRTTKDPGKPEAIPLAAPSSASWWRTSPSSLVTTQGQRISNAVFMEAGEIIPASAKVPSNSMHFYLNPEYSQEILDFLAGQGYSYLDLLTSSVPNQSFYLGENISLSIVQALTQIGATVRICAYGPQKTFWEHLND